MGAVMILCPRTGIYVSTGIETDRTKFALMADGRFTMRCWRCGGDHDWSKRWAILASDVPASARVGSKSELVHDSRQ